MTPITVAIILCTITAPTKDPFHQIKFSDCKRIEHTKNYAGNLVHASRRCGFEAQVLLRAINGPMQEKIRKATQFPFVSKRKGVKIIQCLFPKPSVKA